MRRLWTINLMQRIWVLLWDRGRSKKKSYIIDNDDKRNIFKHLRAISDILIFDDVESILNGKYDRAFILYNNVVICGTDNILKFHKLIVKLWRFIPEYLYWGCKTKDDIIKFIDNKLDSTKT